MERERDGAPGENDERVDGDPLERARRDPAAQPPHRQPRSGREGRDAGRDEPQRSFDDPGADQEDPDRRQQADSVEDEPVRARITHQRLLHVRRARAARRPASSAPETANARTRAAAPPYSSGSSTTQKPNAAITKSAQSGLTRTRPPAGPRARSSGAPRGARARACSAASGRGRAGARAGRRSRRPSDSARPGP